MVIDKKRKCKVLGKFYIYSYKDMLKARELLNNGCTVTKDDENCIIISG
jgi:hypothetical protein